MGAAGTRMAGGEHVTSKNVCGTQAPGWLDGDHPADEGMIVTARICFFWKRKPCQWKMDGIKIAKCQGYFVYQLPNIFTCRAKYCGA